MVLVGWLGTYRRRGQVLEMTEGRSEVRRLIRFWKSASANGVACHHRLIVARQVVMINEIIQVSAEHSKTQGEDWEKACASCSLESLSPAYNNSSSRRALLFLSIPTTLYPFASYFSNRLRSPSKPISEIFVYWLYSLLMIKRNEEDSTANMIDAIESTDQDSSSTVELSANMVRVWSFYIAMPDSDNSSGRCAGWRSLHDGESILPRSNSQKTPPTSREGMQ